MREDHPRELERIESGQPRPGEKPGSPADDAKEH
jgi:hypothetical protein